MFKKVAPYVGEYKKYTVWAAIMMRVLYVAICEIVYSFSYVQGLTFSHVSAYNTLKNIRISLQGKLEKQPIGNILELGTGHLNSIS